MALASGSFSFGDRNGPTGVAGALIASESAPRPRIREAINGATAAVGKDPSQFGCHDRALNQASARGVKADAVGDPRATLFLLEEMLVLEVLERSSHLSVGEAVGRLPMGDLALPAKGKTSPAYAVVDLGSDGQHGTGGQDLEPKPCGCHDVEEARVG